MKTLSQIIRYTFQCRFPDEDWQKVLAYCRERFKGGKIHKSIKPISTSTYEQFLKWIDEGYGSGDMVSYGNTMGIVCTATPDKTILTAYLDYEGNLIDSQMEVCNPERLHPLDEDRQRQLRKLMLDNGVCYSTQSHTLTPLYTPKENSYAIIENKDCDVDDVGMYLESDGYKHKFAAIVRDGELFFDQTIDTDYTPLRRAGEKDIQRFHKAVSKAGYTYNARARKFVIQPKKGKGNYYYYLSDRFAIVTEKDNGENKHAERFAVGNYFLNLAEAILFMNEVKRMRGIDVN